ncbi:MAG: helix-turn-helix domain-containing protein [Tannerella sp.]|nr:helix-turn-helix domain-containing protein [Tannerella sp.]
MRTILYILRTILHDDSLSLPAIEDAVLLKMLTRKVACLYLMLLLFSFPSEGKERSFRTLGPSQGMTKASAISIWQDKWGRMWIGNEVLNCYNGDQVTVYRLSEYFKDIEDADIHGICGNDSVLYLLAEEDLICLDLNTNKLKRPGIHASAIYAVKDQLYYSYEDQLYILNVTGLNEPVFKCPDGASIITILATENEIWLGTTTGLLKLERSPDAVYHTKQIIGSESINSLYRDSRGYIWVSCRSQQAFIVSQEEQVLPLQHQNGTPYSGEIFCFTESPSTGNIWIGTMAGIRLISMNSLRINPDLLLPTSMIYAVYTDRQGTIWIGSYYGSVRYFNPQADNYNFWKTDEERYDKIHGVVLGSMAEDKSGNLYIATEGSGINIINRKTKTVRHLKAVSDQLPNDKIRTLWYDEKYNRLYISAYIEGLYYLDINTDKIRPVRSDTLDSRLKKVIGKIIPYQNHLILLTQDGIYQMDRRTLEISYLFQEPELRKLCTGFIRTIHIDDRDILWVSTLKDGLFTINLPDRKFIRSYPAGSETDGQLPSAIVSICGDSKQGLFFATSKSGLLNYIIEKDSFRIFSVKDNWLLNDICYNLTLTSTGNLVVTSNQGITLLNISAHKTIDSSWHIRLNDSYPVSEIGEDCGLFVSPKTGDIYVGGLYGMFSFSEKEMHLPNTNYSLYLSSLLINNKPYGQGNIADLKKIVLPHNQNTLNITFATSNYMPAYHTRYQYKMEGLDSYWNDTEHKTITYSSLRPGSYHLIIQETTNPEKRIILDIQIKSPFWLSWPAFLIYIIILAILLRAFWLFYKGKAELRASLEMERREIDRMEEINRNQIDFFTSISNEFRTPLTLIISISYSLLQELSGLRKTKIIQVRKQAYFLQNLITEFLDLQKVGWNKLSLKINSFSYPDFIHEMCTSFSIYAQGKTFTYPRQYDETVMLWFDRIQLQKVFYNIFPAAFQLIDPKGKVAVHISKKTGWLETAISCYTNVPDQTILTRLLETLNDTNDLQPNIHSLPGNRIGLVLAKRIIELHKGELFVTTENNVITIYICLKLGEKHFSDEELSILAEPAEPLLIPQEELVEETTVTDDPLHEETKKYRLLLIDHNNEMLKLFTDIFSPAFDLSIKHNGKDGYAYTIKEQPDLIIAEMSTPDISGIELCKMIKSNVKTMNIPIILISSSPSEKQQIEAIQAGADEYIVKPFNANILYLRCNRLIRNQKRLLNQLKKQTDEEISFAEITTNQQDQAFLKKATQVIEENFDNIDFDTTIWSKYLGIGRTQLFNRIKSITGMTPNDYILSVKMNHAMILLRQDNQITVSEIAYGLGFSNPAYFTRCFKKYTGVTPQQFRQTDHN